MSTSKDEPKITLKVVAGDDETEIFLLDGTFQLVGRGIGMLDTAQPPGIYKIKLRTGTNTKEELVVLQNDPVTKTYPPIQFASAAPLVNTALTPEYHVSAAYEHSRKPTVNAGQGSSIFLFTRIWSGRRAEPSPTLVNPAEGIVIRDFAGKVIVDVARAAVLESHDDPSAACRVEVNPGNYRLTVTLEGGLVLEQALVASPNWQTQVFILKKRQPNRANLGPDDLSTGLLDMSVMLSADLEFKPDSPAMRRAELARQALLNQRPVVSTELKRLLHDKVEYPMLGIYAAHIILSSPEPDLDLVRTVVQNLRSLVGPANPDVEALALACNVKNSSYVFNEPPMLLRSWRIIVNETIQHPELVPRDTFSSKISERLVASKLWLIWKAGDAQDAQEGDLPDYEGTLNDLCTGYRASQAKRFGRSRKDPIPEATVKDGLLGTRGMFGPPAKESKRPDVDALVRTLGVPRANVEAALERLMDESDASETQR